MNNYDRVLKYAKDHYGYITSKDISSININSTFLSNLVKKGKLERVGRSVYKLPDYPLDSFYVLSKSSDNMCYSHSSALYLHNLSNRIPQIQEVTVPYNYSGSLLKDNNVSLRYVKESAFNIGMCDVKTTDNHTVKAYDLEKTLCDIIKDRNRMDKEIYSNALKAYAKRKDKNLIKLTKYSKQMGIEKEVVEIMEVLL